MAGPASTATALGLLQSKMLTPATASWALPFAAYYSLLSLRVVAYRLKTKTYLGERSVTSSSADKSTTAPGKAGKTEGPTEVPDQTDWLFVAGRAQGNFIENVPLGLIMAVLAELNGGSRRGMSWALGAFFALRIAHVELGLMRKNQMGLGRITGYYGSLTWIAGMATYCTYLAREYWML